MFKRNETLVCSKDCDLCSRDGRKIVYVRKDDHLKITKVLDDGYVALVYLCSTNESHSCFVTNADLTSSFTR